MATKDTITAAQGDTVDIIARRLYGAEATYTEAILAANPGLAVKGPILPLGTVVNLPDLPDASTTPVTPLVTLWD